MKKVIVWILCISMMFTASLTFGVSAEAVATIDVWDGTTDISWYTENADTKKVTITTPEQFAGIIALCSSGGAEYAASNAGNFLNGWVITLGADLYFNVGNASDWGTTAPANLWSNSSFKGHLNGNGYSLNGLYQSKSGNEGGLFSCLQPGAIVENVSILNSYFSSAQYCGSVVGYARNVSGGNISVSNVYSDAIVYAVGGTSGAGACAGGIVGNDADTSGSTLIISNCVFAGEVYATNIFTNANGNEEGYGTRVGGIIGSMRSNVTVQNCLVTGTVYGYAQIGGIAGAMEKKNGVRSIDNCGFFGKLVVRRSTTSTNGYSGSMIGIIYNDCRTGTITDCYYDASYQAIYVGNSQPSAEIKAKVWGSNGTSADKWVNKIEPTCHAVTKEAYFVNGAISMSALDTTNTWKIVASENGKYSYLPSLKTVNDNMADTAIKFKGFQPSTDGTSIRLLADVKNVEVCKTIVLKVELVSAAKGTMVFNEVGETVYSAFTVDGGEDITPDAGYEALYGYAIKGIPATGENLQINVTPVMTVADGIVITGQTYSFFYSVGNAAA